MGHAPGAVTAAQPWVPSSSVCPGPLPAIVPIPTPTFPLPSVRPRPGESLALLATQPFFSLLLLLLLFFPLLSDGIRHVRERGKKGKEGKEKKDQEENKIVTHCLLNLFVFIYSPRPTLRCATGNTEAVIYTDAVQLGKGCWE